MSTNIETMLETVERVFTAAEKTVESMQEGQRMQIKELASVVSSAVSMEPKQVLGFVNHFVHNTTLAYVTRGKNGGIIRGSKPVKVVKAPKKSAVTSAPTDDSAETV
jgi:hypothetical protein